MAGTNSYGMPGIKLPAAVNFYEILWSDAGKVTLPTGVIIDGTKSRDIGNAPDTSVLRGGMPLGKVTATGKFANSFIDATTVAAASGTTSITISVAGAAEVVRRIGSSGTLTITGAPTTGGTVAQATLTYSAVNTSTGVITVTATTAAFEAGSFIGDTDGSQNPAILIGGGDGIQVTDEWGNSQDAPLANAIIGGLIQAAQIIGYPGTGTSRSKWLKSQLRSFGYAYCFNDDF